MTPESAIKAEIKAYLDGLDCYHFPVTNHGYGKRGVPDRIICYRGRFIGIEVKAPGGVATAWQRRAIEEIVEAGGVAEVVWSVDDVRSLIERIENDREG